MPLCSFPQISRHLALGIWRTVTFFNLFESWSWFSTGSPEFVVPKPTTSKSELSGTFNTVGKPIGLADFDSSTSLSS